MQPSFGSKSIFAQEETYLDNQMDEEELEFYSYCSNEVGRFSSQNEEMNQSIEYLLETGDKAENLFEKKKTSQIIDELQEIEIYDRMEVEEILYQREN